MISGTKPVV